jgi:Cyclopropane fatty acid synthase and related methyltransferases
VSSNTRQQTVFAPEQEFYQAYSTEEDRERTNVHYEQPVEFFYAVTGGRWNVYSCNLWEEGIDPEDQTASQEAKLDLTARLAGLKPGMRILDVGCGWGGPLTYLCKTYGVTGVGLTLSPAQKRAAEERAAREGVASSVEIVECHWRDYEDAVPFDAVTTDEVIVHFNDLGGFFEKAFSLLREGGRMVNKELHFTHPRYSRMTRGLSLINEIYGSTGNYRALAEELALANAAGFEVHAIHQLSLEHYRKTMGHWTANMHAHKAELEAMVGADYYRRFRGYLKMCQRIFTDTTMTLDVVVSRKAVSGRGGQ